MQLCLVFGLMPELCPFGNYGFYLDVFEDTLLIVYAWKMYDMQTLHARARGTFLNFVNLI